MNQEHTMVSVRDYEMVTCTCRGWGWVKGDAIADPVEAHQIHRNEVAFDPKVYTPSVGWKLDVGPLLKPRQRQQVAKIHIDGGVSVRVLEALVDLAEAVGQSDAKVRFDDGWLVLEGWQKLELGDPI